MNAKLRQTATCVACISGGVQATGCVFQVCCGAVHRASSYISTRLPAPVIFTVVKMVAGATCPPGATMVGREAIRSKVKLKVCRSVLPDDCMRMVRKDKLEN